MKRSLLLTLALLFTLSGVEGLTASAAGKKYYEQPDLTALPQNGRILVYDPATGTDKNVTGTLLLDRSKHIGSQPASTVIPDATHRFVTDTEKAGWSAQPGILANFSGATQAKLDKKLSGATPEQYGAKGDFNPATGTGTNDTAAIQAALNANKLVYLDPARRYLVSSADLTIPAGTALVGG